MRERSTPPAKRREKRGVAIDNDDADELMRVALLRVVAETSDEEVSMMFYFFKVINLLFLILFGFLKNTL